jgi:16S rRNA (cytosine967-C5)-methyltransferase
MSRFHSYISSAVKVIETYGGGKPLMHHLKSFFAAEKKYGSRDRKIISALCYNYFRISHAVKHQTIGEAILTGLFLTEDRPNEILALMRSKWNELITNSLAQKSAFLHIDPLTLFPFSEELSDEIDKEKFALSFLMQPQLFLRLRPGKEKIVTGKLMANSVSFEKINEDCLALANSTRLDDILIINREAVIQDDNSQNVLSYLVKNPGYFKREQAISVWDCCAASGGKSILLFDILKGRIELTVTDIRDSILQNLDKRLKEAGVPVFKKTVADLTKKNPFPAEEKFSIIICDAPCTGSGTWSRTPEQLLHFDDKDLLMFAERQKQIVSNAVPYLQQGGLFFYITCSVFKKENEEIAMFIKEKFHMQLLQKEYLKGYDKRADNMFVAVFTK